jgi:ribosome-binding protein aMBF1 (putative translation factor)
MIGQSDRDHIAARWLIEQDDPEFSDQQRAELARWLVGDIENCVAYLRLVHAWRKTALLSRHEMPVSRSRRSPASEGSHTVPGETRARVRPADPHAATVDKVFGKILRSARRAKGWSQEKLAIEAQLTKSYIARLESGRVSVTLTVLFQVAGAIGVSASEFVVEVERALRADS